jgi:hypothetical protein
LAGRTNDALILVVDLQHDGGMRSIKLAQREALYRSSRYACGFGGLDLLQSEQLAGGAQDVGRSDHPRQIA